jgi:hypothetical protein
MFTPTVGTDALCPKCKGELVSEPRTYGGHALAHIKEIHDFNGGYVSDLIAAAEECVKLRADKERLDFLATHLTIDWPYGKQVGLRCHLYTNQAFNSLPSLREAIDSARRALEETK